MAAEVFSANRATVTVPFGGTDAPASGTSESWTVTSSTGFPAAATGVSQFHVADPVLPSEIIAVTNVSGTTWTVTRGAESTTPVAHSAGFTVSQVVTTGFLGGVAPLASPAFTGTVTVTGQFVKTGPTAYVFTPVGSSSAYLVIDKSASAADSSLVLRDQGAVRAEVGLTTSDDNLHIKAVTGSAGSETFTDAILVLNASANVEVVNSLGVGTAPAAQFHVAGAAGSSARTLAKLENTTGAGAGFDFVGDSPNVQWGLLTDIALNGGNNFGIFDLVAGYPPQVTVVGGGGGAAIGSDTVQPSAAHSLDVVGSIKTRGIQGLSAMNLVGRGTAIGAPLTGTFQANDVMMDSAGSWFYCTAGGSPGTWTA